MKLSSLTTPAIKIDLRQVVHHSHHFHSERSNGILNKLIMYTFLRPQFVVKYFRDSTMKIRKLQNIDQDR
ncbi:hypothetical protein GE061_009873 [Apolygus lucorum]|uniref:Uncharacterized protein n=1 Tax=Apolygus lucorum TaxID=248454 RepID=A0A8S9Y2T5_APOLU|nr:hypothetical protein GE061_009873 [Apolygus lucorum]